MHLELSLIKFFNVPADIKKPVSPGHENSCSNLRNSPQLCNQLLLLIKSVALMRVVVNVTESVLITRVPTYSFCNLLVKSTNRLHGQTIIN